MQKDTRFEMRISAKKLEHYKAIAKAAKLSLAEWVEMKCDGEASAPITSSPVVRTTHKPIKEKPVQKKFVCLLKGVKT